MIDSREIIKTYVQSTLLLHTNRYTDIKKPRMRNALSIVVRIMHALETDSKEPVNEHGRARVYESYDFDRRIYR